MRNAIERSWVIDKYNVDLFLPFQRFNDVMRHFNQFNSPGKPTLHTMLATSEKKMIGFKENKCALENDMFHILVHDDSKNICL